MITPKKEIERDYHGRCLPGYSLQDVAPSSFGLRQLCLDTLNSVELFGNGKTLAQNVIERVAVEKPEALLAFMGRMLPKEITQQITKASPIVLTLGGPADQQDAIVIEQTEKQTTIE